MSDRFVTNIIVPSCAECNIERLAGVQSASAASRSDQNELPQLFVLVKPTISELRCPWSALPNLPVLLHAKQALSAFAQSGRCVATSEPGMLFKGVHDICQQAHSTLIEVSGAPCDGRLSNLHVSRPFSKAFMHGKVLRSSSARNEDPKQDRGAILRRTPGEFSQGHPPGAVNIPVTQPDSRGVPGSQHAVCLSHNSLPRQVVHAKPSIG